MPIFRLSNLVLLITLLSVTSCFTRTKEPLSQVGFSKWKSDFIEYAINQNIDHVVVGNAFSEISFTEKFIIADKNQFTTTESLSDYYSKHINNAVFYKAKKIKEDQHELLRKIAKQYNIDPNYILSLWGMETKFGTYSGTDNVVESLANLTYEGRRSTFFSGELIYALKMLEDNSISYIDFNGSWAGATGQIQFMPSSYYKYAVDYNNDGKVDIWNNNKDILASAANYLSTLNWDDDLPWGYEVQTLNNAKFKKLINGKTRKSLKRLVKYGIHKSDNSEFSSQELSQDVRIVSYDKRFFVVFPNYEILKHWNNSDYFAITVGLFAETL